MRPHRMRTRNQYLLYALKSRRNSRRDINNVLSQEDDKHFEVRLSDESFETFELDPPPYTLDVTKKELKQMYYDMVVIRYDFHISS